MPADGAVFSDANSEPSMEFLCLLCVSDLSQAINYVKCPRGNEGQSITTEDCFDDKVETSGIF